MCNFPIDPKAIHDALEEQGLETNCWLMSEHGRRATYRIIVTGAPDDLVALSQQILGAVVEKATVNLRRQASGQVIGTLIVHASQGEPA